MKVKFSEIKQIDNSGLDEVSTNGFARFANMNVSFVHRIKRNQVVISEDLYNKINTLLTNYRNNSNIN